MEHDLVGFGTDHEIRNGQRTALGPFTTCYYVLLLLTPTSDKEYYVE